MYVDHRKGPSMEPWGPSSTEQPLAYADFLASKTRLNKPVGHIISPGDVHPRLHPFQRDIVQWSVKQGRAAIWTTTGTGKTAIQLEWARLSGKTSLIVTPLAVAQQTVREANLLDIDARYIRDGSSITGPGIWVTNYEMIDRFDPMELDAVVLDESSIMKNSTGKTRTKLIRHFAGVDRRLSCTATPAPNDMEELTNQAEFLGVCSRVDMLATFFIHDADGWRVKKHARAALFRWMAEWAVALRSPSDLGYSDEGYDLPGLTITPHIVLFDGAAQFADGLGGITGRSKARKASLYARCMRAASLVVVDRNEPWLLWCGLNAEADLLAEIIPGAVNVCGSMTPEAKANALLAFADGHIRVLISKPSIAGHGMNFQHCARMAFVGLSDSWEQYFQAIRRCYRYGQIRVVEAHIVLSEVEQEIANNVQRKEQQATEMISELVAEMHAARERATA